MSEEPATEGKLKQSLSARETERDNLLRAIRDARTEARRTAIESAACRQHVEQATIDHWQRQIKENQEQLMRVQAQIGETNRRLRALRSDTNNQCNQQPQREKARQEQETLYLSCFHQIAQGSLDPRLFAAIERDAKRLAADHDAMFGREAAS